MPRRKYGDTKKPTTPYPGNSPNEDKGKRKEVGESSSPSTSSKVEPLKGPKRVIIYTVFEGIYMPVKDNDTVTSVMDLYMNQIAHRHRINFANVKQLLDEGTRLRPISYGKVPKICVTLPALGHILGKKDTVDTNRFLDLFTSPGTATTPPDDELALLAIIPHQADFFTSLIISTQLYSRYLELQDRHKRGDTLTKEEKKIKNGLGNYLTTLGPTGFSRLYPLYLRTESVTHAGVQTSLVEPQNPTLVPSTTNVGIQVNSAEPQQSPQVTASAAVQTDSVFVIPTQNYKRQGKRKDHQRRRSQELLDNNLDQMAVEVLIHEAQQEREAIRVDRNNESKRHSQEIKRLQDDRMASEQMMKDSNASLLQYIQDMKEDRLRLIQAMEDERLQLSLQIQQMQQDAERERLERKQMETKLSQEVEQERRERKQDVERERQARTLEEANLKRDLSQERRTRTLEAERDRREREEAAATERQNRKRLENSFKQEKEDLTLKAKREKEELEAKLASMQADTKNVDKKIEKYIIHIDGNLSDRIRDLELFALSSDPDALLAIRLRVMLDMTQGRLAVWVGLVVKFDRYSSRQWRNALDGDGDRREEDLTVRLQTATILLTEWFG